VWKNLELRGGVKKKEKKKKRRRMVDELRTELMAPSEQLG